MLNIKKLNHNIFSIKGITLTDKCTPSNRCQTKNDSFPRKRSAACLITWAKKIHICAGNRKTHRT